MDSTIIPGSKATQCNCSLGNDVLDGARLLLQLTHQKHRMKPSIVKQTCSLKPYEPLHPDTVLTPQPAGKGALLRTLTPGIISNMLWSLSSWGPQTSLKLNLDQKPPKMKSESLNPKAENPNPKPLVQIPKPRLLNPTPYGRLRCWLLSGIWTIWRTGARMKGLQFRVWGVPGGSGEFS